MKLQTKKNIMTFTKYKPNLTKDGNFIILEVSEPVELAYTTKVAEIKGNELHQLGCWSVTTQKHINS